jgi:hypothetical protein
MSVSDTETAAGKAFKKELEELFKLQVRVGIQRGSGSSDDGADYVDIAAYNELGTDTIPSRPFLRQAADKNEGVMRQNAQVLAKQMTQGGTAKDVYRKMGVMLETMIQDEIASGNFVPNAPSTVASKGSSTPLIDTGRLRQSIHHQIVERGKS